MANKTTFSHSYPLEGTDESARLQNQHEVIKADMGGLVLAPIDLSASPLRIIDSGTADGTWLRDLHASTAPVEHKLYGTDVSESEFPDDSALGIVYWIQDVKQPWPKDWEGQFDLVHQRLVLVAAGAEQKKATLAYAGLVKPGGWIQLIEATNELREGYGPNMRAFVQLMRAIFKHMGADVDLMQHLAGWLEEAGFTDIKSRDIEMKIGATNPEPDLARRGVISTGIAVTGLSQFGKSLPHGALPFPVEKLDTLPSDLKEELKEVGAIYPLRVVWAHKPTA
ncbi:hypothetical protein GGR57DRAFT_494179 [Xylariaceae sp. FL1272]|nr:hypothetical protein GGR57DRAFT_494179 [Xylariaceae sp. FL1272]